MRDDDDNGIDERKDGDNGIKYFKGFLLPNSYVFIFIYEPHKNPKAVIGINSNSIDIQQQTPPSPPPKLSISSKSIIELSPPVLFSPLLPPFLSVLVFAMSSAAEADVAASFSCARTARSLNSSEIPSPVKAEVRNVGMLCFFRRDDMGERSIEARPVCIRAQERKGGERAETKLGNFGIKEGQAGEIKKNKNTACGRRTLSANSPIKQLQSNTHLPHLTSQLFSLLK